MKVEEIRSPAVQRYADDYAALAARLPGNRVVWAERIRRDALERFRAVGFPTLRHEDWKYTNVAALERRHFAPRGAPGEAAAEAVAAHIFSDLDADVLVFVDGWYEAALSHIDSLPADASVRPLSAALADDARWLQPHLGSVAGGSGFDALNAALWCDGAAIRLEPGARLPRPVHLIFMATGGGHAAHVRNVVVAGEGSEVTVIEHYVSLPGAEALTTVETRIEVGANAGVEHVKLLQEDAKSLHIAAIRAVQARDSRFTSHSVAMGAQLARNDIETRFDGPGAEATLNGLYLAAGRQHVDHHTRIDHAVPRCASREFYRGILDGHGRGVFNGRVLVREDAQQTDAQQVNNNLLLSREAEIDTKPQLEIFADDVKCAHGATVGQLDEDMLFYLRSRGVGEAAARSLLTYAFANDVLNRIRLEPVRLRLEQALLNRLPEGESIRESL
jgi:Fe-S cluster assembly protein SufD